ncbi:ornithine carbamoyltransferase, partial [bacterium]|nr:ornithine carbamoyltransferase [bacterium]
MKHLLSIADLSKEEIGEIFKKTQELKTDWKKGVVSPILAGKSLALLFQKPSLRTRVSFEVGMRQLGGQALYLSPDEVQLGKREAVKDAAKVLSRYVDIIMARVFSHETVVELAKHSEVPVINGLSDKLHPCQVLSDIYTILERRGNLKDLKVAFVGDGDNVANSWLYGASKLGINLSVATPEGYEPDGGVLSQAKEEAKSNGSRVEVIHDPAEAVKRAHVIYTDTWVSMGQEEEKEKKERVFPPYQVNQNLLEKA